MGQIEWGILFPAFLAGMLVLATHVPLGQMVIERGIVFIDLAVAQVAGLGVALAALGGWEDVGWAVQLSAAAAAAGGLNLAAGAAYGNLVGVAAANSAAAAAGALRVAPGDPDHSFLLRKLLGQIAPAEGSRMPLVGTPPSAANLDLIRRWIAAGAPETAPF